MNKEHISAFMDGEATTEEVEEVIDSLGEDPTLRGKWSRYHLIGEVLRSDRFVTGEKLETLGKRKMLRIEAPTRKAILSRPAIGLAMAASIVVVALTVVLFLSGAPDKPEYLISEFEPGDALDSRYIDPEEQEADQTVVQIGKSESVREHQLNGYFTNYNRQRARLGVPGVNPYVRMVGFDSE